MLLIDLYNNRQGDTTTLARVEAALWLHAKYLIGFADATQAQKDWANYTLTADNARQKALNMMPEVVTDPAYPFPSNDTGDAGITYIVNSRGELY